jgi:hypothetical protein
MNTHIGRSKEKVIKTVQELLLDEENRSSITPALISEKIDLVLAMTPRWGEGLQRQSVIDELIRRFSLWIGQDMTLVNEVGHTPWLVSSRKEGWRYWRRYEEWTERKLSPTAVSALDESTDLVLGLLEDPNREGQWDRRGMVVGHVQSGKTGHYTGLICKAADAGYKVIIVLAGLHNNLRSQTQIRLDEGFLGYETRPNVDDLPPVGVGEIDSDPAIRPNHVTNRSEKGDFTTAISRHLGITPEQRPWLFVVKKNKTPLEKLYQWIRNHVADSHDQGSGRKLVTNLPLLLIDDEADHASVDTGEQVLNLDGTPNDEHSPTAINSRIRKILHSFARSGYVGYTATPFANIFIHERGATREEGPDLFPSGFIHNLAAPSTYIGPSKVFGTPGPEGRVGGLPLLRTISDQVDKDSPEGWMPLKHPNGHLPRCEGRDQLPPSLTRAVDSFILSCAARSLRGQDRDHSSMLIHVTRFTSVQSEVYRQVEDQVKKIRQRILRQIDADAILHRLEELWESDFRNTSEEVARLHPDPTGESIHDWEDIKRTLPVVLADIQVRMINGTAKDALDYSDSGELGLKVIAIGGDKLSRGLTLEGLCVSYFLRASKMYDTLMQMGRWFGYRPGYLDLCRLYTTPDLVDWFAHIADASEELREEFELMAASKATPREYGLKVQSHPVLMVTSRLKMRAAKNLLLSFSGMVLETVDFFKDNPRLQSNLEAARGFIGSLGTPEVNPSRRRGEATHNWEGFLWSSVPSAQVIEFLGGFRTHPEAYKVNRDLLTEFIQSMNGEGELTSWTVALIGGGKGTTCEFQPGIKVGSLRRKDDRKPGKYAIGRLLSPRDEAIDLDEEAWTAAMEETVRAWEISPKTKRGPEGPAEEDRPKIPSGPAIRKIRGFGGEGIQAHPERGLLLLYALDPILSGAEVAGDAPHVIAFGMSFPGSHSGTKVEYVVNNVLWEQEYGASD